MPLIPALGRQADLHEFKSTLGLHELPGLHRKNLFAKKKKERENEGMNSVKLSSAEILGFNTTKED